MHAKACAAGSTRCASTGRAEKPKAAGGCLLAAGNWRLAPGGSHPAGTCWHPVNTLLTLFGTLLAPAWSS